MHYCPNCDARVLEKAQGCKSCGADFGYSSSWRPVVAPPKRQAQPRKDVREEVGGCWTKVAGTLWLVGWSALLAFLLPFGGRVGVLFLALYLASVPVALFQLWQSAKLPTLFLVLGSVPLFFPVLVVMALLLGQ